MSESAAILIWLADAFPDAGLAPLAGDPRRPAFLRWMTFVSSAIYALYWITDNPARVSDDETAHDAINGKLYARIAECWGVMDRCLTAGTLKDKGAPRPYLLGDRLSVLDLYVATASRWSPGRRSFYSVAPGLADAVRRTDAEPALAALWAERFPFSEGWER